MKPNAPIDMDTYIAGFPKEIRKLLEQIRETIKKTAAHAEEVISYQMPAFTYHGILVYFAAFKNHIGFYPTASGISSFQKELVAYTCTKGSIHFPYDKPLPLGLIAKIAKFRVRENLDRMKEKKSRTASPRKLARGGTV